MKIIRFKDIENVPASHEDPKDPGVLKKVLLRSSDLIKGPVQMVNWATLLPGKSYASHHHEDLQEISIIISGIAVARVDGAEVTLRHGDALVVDPKEVHQMHNSGKEPVIFVAVGISGKSALA